MSLATVFVVDDDPSARKSLRWLLGSVNLPVKTFQSGEEFLQEYDEQQPGCVVLDLRMPGMGGLAVLTQLAARDIPPPVIVVTGYGTVSTAVRAMRAGAVHVLEKPYDDQELLDTIQEAFQRDERNRAEHARRVTAKARMDTLTPREREVLDLMVAGKTNKVIARQLQVSEKSIEYHRANIYEKMHADSLAELLRMVLAVIEPKLGAAPEPAREGTGHLGARVVSGSAGEARVARGLTPPA